MTGQAPRTTAMRADVALVHAGLCASRTHAQTLIAQGQAWLRNPLAQSDGQRIVKASFQVLPEHELWLQCEGPQFVSRGGQKLHAALQHIAGHLGGHLAGCRVLDLGQSTGGFTDCMLQQGAQCVLGLDVGHDQLHPNLRKHPNVAFLEGINLKEVTAKWVAELALQHPKFFPIDWVVLDVSFIAQHKVLPFIQHLLNLQLCAGTVNVLSLIKPQFELQPEHIGKGGLVKNPTQMAPRVVNQVSLAWQQLGFTEMETFPCAMTGTDGNQEYFLWAQHAKPQL